MNEGKNILVGKVLTGIKLAADKHAILFQTSEGDIKVDVDGDCCSQSWVESIELPALGFPCYVRAVEDLELNKEPVSNEEYECLQFYGLKIVSSKGEIIIDYRNESSGYYGGNLSWPDGGYFYGGVFGQNKSNYDWQDVDA